MHSGQHRLEAQLAARLREAYPQGEWTVVNEARGGEWIGPGTQQSGTVEPLLESETTGRYFEVRERVARADVVVVAYGGNDSKCYPPTTFGKRLAALCDRLARDYPGVRIVLATGMYLDYPAHADRYWRDPPQVPGWKSGSTSRNEYFAPYFDAARALARERGYGLADMCLGLRAETAAGNWDLRIRNWREGERATDAGAPVPAEVDQTHRDHPAWFDNVHPNYEGTRIIAEVYFDVLGKMMVREESARGGRE